MFALNKASIIKKVDIFYLIKAKQKLKASMKFRNQVSLVENKKLPYLQKL